MASTMKICGGCQRHVWGAESRCPFCRAPLPTAPSPLRSVRMVMFGLTIALGTSACGPVVMPDGTPAAESSTGVDPGLTTTTTATTDAAETTSINVTSSSSTGLDGIDSSADDSADQGCSFYGGCPSDSGPVVYECDIFAQDCPPGEKCMPWANDGGGTWNATRCSPIADDPGQPGEPCTVEGSSTSGIDDCDISSMCFDVDPRTNQGTCAEMCTGTPDEPLCTDRGDLCLHTNNGAVALCLRECDPLLQDCLPGEGCYPMPYPDAFVCVPTWPPAAGQGMPCDSINDCAAGNLCVDNGLFDSCDGGACCAQICDLAAAEPNLPCEALVPGYACQTYYEIPPPGYEDVGVCRVPA